VVQAAAPQDDAGEASFLALSIADVEFGPLTYRSGRARTVLVATISPQTPWSIRRLKGSVGATRVASRWVDARKASCITSNTVALPSDDSTTLVLARPFLRPRAVSGVGTDPERTAGGLAMLAE
jgi:hypothetical protein